MDACVPITRTIIISGGSDESVLCEGCWSGAAGGRVQPDSACSGADSAADPASRPVADVELGIDDGRFISVQQRRKIYATLRDIAEYTGYPDEDMKQIMKVEHVMRCGCDMFSLSDCSMTTAREFINTLMEYALKEGVILTESGLQRTDDIDTYLMRAFGIGSAASVADRLTSITWIRSAWEMTGAIMTTARTGSWRSAGSIIRSVTRGERNGSVICTRCTELSGTGRKRRLWHNE